jgi:hypothetical protein
MWAECVLTFELPGRYLHFSTWFMKNVLFEQKEIKLLNKQNFVENKTGNATFSKNSKFHGHINT